ncbi:MAG: high-affinity branched-chain amino acid ABC transporter permease LivM [Candidatus Portiera sp.]|nr:high-affinity branched-chain amino acid ABC transporter permease LivM [Portiera sp.]
MNTSNIHSHKVSLRLAITDALVAGLIALVLFGPIVGLVLDGYELRNNMGVAFIFVAIITTGRFFASLFFQSPIGVRFLEKFARGRKVRVTVAQASTNKFKKLLLPAIFLAALSYPVIAHVAPDLLGVFGGKYGITIMILALIYVLLGLGLNIVVGLAGLLDLGYVAFYAIGAYWLTIGYAELGLGFWSVLIISPIFAAGCGAILGFPVLRMHGDYLAIVTLGFGEIIRLVLNNWTSLTRGPNGMSAPDVTFFNMLSFNKRGADNLQPFHEFFGLEYSSSFQFIYIYWLLLIVVFLVLYINHRLVQMPVGRAWEALREDEIACRSLGLNHVLVKLSAFMIGASVGGVAGVFFASYQGFVNPSSFTFLESALIVAIVVLGGLGSALGVTIAAIVLTLLPELLREFSDYRVLMFGILMIVMMIWRPRGLVKPVRPAFESDKEQVKQKA